MSSSGIQRLWSRLEEEERELKIEKAKIRDVWLMITDAHQKNEEERKKLKSDALFDFIDPHTRLILNVGGQVFETTAELLCRDKYSILASLCRKSNIALKSKGDGENQYEYYLDRDWWIFRYLLQYMRDGILPENTTLLKEMYIEAAFYRLDVLRRAIERRFSQVPSFQEKHRRYNLVDSLAGTNDNFFKTTTSTTKSSSTKQSNSKLRSLPDPYGFLDR